MVGYDVTRMIERFDKLRIESPVIKRSVHFHSINLSRGKIEFYVSIWALPKEVQVHHGATKEVREYAYQQHKSELLSLMQKVFGKGLEITEEPEDLSSQLFFTLTATF